MHALPAISQMIQDGYDITVNCKEFQRPIYKAIGCKTVCMREPFGLSWFLEHGNDYGRIISLHAWDVWDLRQFGYNTTGTMQTFAEILDTNLPEEFSWVKTLGVENFLQNDYILFVPNALEKWRSLPPEVADRVEMELSDFGEVKRINGNECATWEELRDLIYGASYVVAVEGGISNVAGALGKKMLCLVGMTEVETTVEQYRKYIPDLEYRVVQGFQPNGCSMPCMRMKDKGFFNDKCLGVNDLPVCLSQLNISKVTEEFSLLVRS